MNSLLVHKHTHCIGLETLTKYKNHINKIYEPVHEILVLIELSNNECSGEYEQTRGLTRVFVAYIIMQYPSLFCLI